MKIFLMALTICTFTMVFTSSVLATETQAIEENLPISNKVVEVSVNGLVCDFCARALEKVFGKEEAVNSIDVNLDTKVILITFNENKSLTNERITKLVVDSGYNVENIHRVE